MGTLSYLHNVCIFLFTCPFTGLKTSIKITQTSCVRKQMPEDLKLVIG
jgi:hypothetical protein